MIAAGVARAVSGCWLADSVAQLRVDAVRVGEARVGPVWGLMSARGDAERASDKISIRRAVLLDRPA